MGSTRVARRAGMKQASSATIASKQATPAKVNGSVALTLKSKVDKSREKASAAKTLMATPRSVSRVTQRTQELGIHIAALGAKGDANAKLLRPLGDVVSDQAVDADSDK